MFIPATFKQDNLAEIATFIRSHSLATLITPNGEVAHIPMILQTEENGELVLVGHCFKRNPIVSAMSQPQTWLAIFQENGHYISPNWYPNKAITHKEVPTWNYQAVHIRGAVRQLDDVVAVLTAQTDFWESCLPNNTPWQLSDAPEDYLQALYQAIVCFEIKVEKTEAQFKLSQNKDTATKQSICQNLRQINSPQACTMAELIEHYTNNA